MKTSRALMCYTCTIRASIANMRQMANRSGPAYDQWLAGMERAHREGRITDTAIERARASVGAGMKPKHRPAEPWDPPPAG